MTMQASDWFKSRPSDALKVCTRLSATLLACLVQSLPAPQWAVAVLDAAVAAVDTCTHALDAASAGAAFAFVAPLQAALAVPYLAFRLALLAVAINVLLILLGIWVALYALGRWAACCAITIDRAAALYAGAIALYNGVATWMSCAARALRRWVESERDWQAFWLQGPEALLATRFRQTDERWRAVARRAMAHVPRRHRKRATRQLFPLPPSYFGPGSPRYHEAPCSPFAAERESIGAVRLASDKGGVRDVLSSSGHSVDTEAAAEGVVGDVCNSALGCFE